MKRNEAFSKVRKMGFKCKYDCGGWRDDIILTYWVKGNEEIIISENLDGGECTIFKSIK
jgi:hypothetical protein